ncbi:MAG TPA: hypothetical protein VHJ20_17345 [Polyangia bacterium]|nr:hypothetical protein [Polyangia bacterium]
MKKLALVVALAPALLAACGPSIDPAAKADIDARVAALSAPKQSYTVPSGFQPMPFAPGQWTRHKLVDENGQPSFLTYKLLSEEGDAFWMEAVTESYTGRTMVKMLIAIPNRTDPASIDIRAVSLKDAKGRVTVIDPMILTYVKDTYRSSLSTFVINWQGLPQEDVVVPAGAFSGCFKARTDASWGPYHSANTSWSHVAVPLSGLVRSQGIDKPTSMELVDFGLTGAKSEF